LRFDISPASFTDSDSRAAKKVFITGVSVAVQRQGTGWYGPAPHWKILEIFYSNLRQYYFGALQVFGSSGRTGYDFALPDSLEFVILNDAPYARLGRIKESPRLYSRLLRAVAASDYVYVRLPSWSGLAAWRCARWLGKPYWVSLHGDWPQILQTYVGNAHTLPLRLYYQFNQWQVERTLQKVLARAKGAFFVGQALYEHLRPDHVPSVAYQDVAHFADEVWKPQAKSRAGPVTLVFVGEVTRAKGIDVLIQALGQLADRKLQVRLIVVGRGAETAALLKQTIPGVEIDVKGWVAHGEDFDNLFRQSDALILPSRTEGVPRVVIEAMVRATPVIATRVGGVPDLLGMGSRGWLIDVDDPAGIATAVQELVSDESQRMMKVQEATSYVTVHDKTYWTEVVGAQLGQIDPDLIG
jgi:glycosyltransferase involved in cell wall biosynthesis